MTAFDPICAKMARFLLTLLALLFGLAATGAPAQARGCAVANAEVGAPAESAYTERCTPALAAVSAPQGHPVGPAAQASVPRPAAPLVLVATVLQGIDRARE